MGLFSIYTGALYNEAFSIPMDFGSHFYYLPHSNHSTFDGGVYPFGVDPGWNGGIKNTLSFYNSLKMKLSIILGVSQVSFMEVDYLLCRCVLEFSSAL